MQTQGQRKHQAKVTTKQGKTLKLCKPHCIKNVILRWNDLWVGDKNALETGVLRDHSSAKLTTGMAALSRLITGVMKCGTSSKTGCQWEKDADLG